MSQVPAVYLDYNATTPVDPAVFEAMKPWLQGQFGNPASASHQWGWAAQAAVQKAREHIAKLLSCKPSELYFTAGATEANNWCIYSLAISSLIKNKEKIHFISTNIEHASIAKALDEVERWGAEVTRLPVDSKGFITIEELEQSIKPHTRLVSIIWVQNEIGTIQNLNEISKFTSKHKILLHSDATQAVGKITIDLNAVHIDLLSCSAHKFYGPKGAGALYIRSKNPHVQLEALLVGGGQEKGLRSGTLNVPAIVGMGKAAEICSDVFTEENLRILNLRNYFLNLLESKIPDLILNGAPDARSPNNLNISFPSLNVNKLTPYLPRLGISQGSACSSEQISSSPILAAIGCHEELAKKTLRFSLGRWTTKDDLDTAAEILINCMR